MRKEYKCPSCSGIKLLAESSYRESVRLKRVCKSCAMRKWQAEKYGVKETRTFISTCSNCGKEKIHTWKNITLTNVEYLKEVNSKRLCRSCSNSIHYTLAKTKSNTKPEREFKKVARKNKIKYTQGYKYEGYNYDFYLPELDILVEVDGSYWHGKGLKDKELNPAQTNSRKNDKKKNKICLATQKSLIRLWDDEVNIEVIKQKIDAVNVKQQTHTIKRKV